MCAGDRVAPLVSRRPGYELFKQASSGNSGKQVRLEQRREEAQRYDDPIAASTQDIVGSAPECHDATHDTIPKATSSGPNLLAGHRRHRRDR